MTRNIVAVASLVFVLGFACPQTYAQTEPVDAPDAVQDEVELPEITDPDATAEPEETLGHSDTEGPPEPEPVTCSGQCDPNDPDWVPSPPPEFNEVVEVPPLPLTHMWVWQCVQIDENLWVCYCECTEVLKRLDPWDIPPSDGEPAEEAQ